MRRPPHPRDAGCRRSAAPTHGLVAARRPLRARRSPPGTGSNALPPARCTGPDVVIPRAGSYGPAPTPRPAREWVHERHADRRGSVRLPAVQRLHRPGRLPRRQHRRRTHRRSEPRMAHRRPWRRRTPARGLLPRAWGGKYDLAAVGQVPPAWCLTQYLDPMLMAADLWSFLSTLPAVISTLAAGLIVAVVAFVLNRLGSRADRRADRQRGPSRRNIRAGRRYLSRLARRPRKIDGPARWSVEFNRSLAAYEVTQHGPDDVHDLRLDFFDTRTMRQTVLTPTVRVSLLPPGLPVTMRLGATSRTQHVGIALRWDDTFGTDQFERLRIGDVHSR